jgi:hypothetical protein
MDSEFSKIALFFGLFFVFAFFLCMFSDMVEEEHKFNIELSSEEHIVRKMTSPTTEKTLHGEASFFLLGGSASIDETVTTTVTFAWLNNNEEYVISTVPLNKIRLKLVTGYNPPTARFCGARRVYSPLCDFEYNYIVITCDEKDWPQDIHLPLNEEEKDER